MMNAREGSDDSTMYNSTSFHYVEFLIDYRSPTVRRFSNLSTLRSDKFIFGFDRVSAKTVNFPANSFDRSSEN
jgi:hypothetical protein